MNDCFCFGHLRDGRVLNEVLCLMVKLGSKNDAGALPKCQCRERSKSKTERPSVSMRGKNWLYKKIRD